MRSRARISPLSPRTAASILVPPRSTPRRVTSSPRRRRRRLCGRRRGHGRCGEALALALRRGTDGVAAGAQLVDGAPEQRRVGPEALRLLEHVESGGVLAAPVQEEAEARADAAVAGA